MPKKNLPRAVSLALLISAFALLFLPAANSASAQGLPLPTCAETGDCDLCDIVNTGIGVFKWAMGLLGGAALLLFVWHGFNLLISGGQAERIEKAKNGLAHTLIGLAIVFGSWMIVNLIVVVLADNPKPLLKEGGVGYLFNGQRAWNQKCGSADNQPARP